MKSTKITLILGTRHQIIKSAPLIHMARKDSDIDIQRRLGTKLVLLETEKPQQKHLKSSKNFTRVH